MKNINKNFGIVKANININLEVRRGEIHALLGENGAGKTTLMKILSGLYRQDSGEIFINGKGVSFFSPKDAMDMGICMVHQYFELVPNFSVTENIILGAHKKIFLDAEKKEKEIMELSKKYGLEIDPKSKIWQLSVGEQQRVEILKMLYRKVKILILDEPTSSLTKNEIKNLFYALRKIKSEGSSVIFITHKLEEVMEIADYITVLRKGKVMATVHTEQIKQMNGIATTELARMMVGREVILKVDKKPVKTGGIILKVENLCVLDDRNHEAVKNITFSVNRGEIFGILGVAGNGQHELVEAIAGMRPYVSGKIQITGKLNYIPEDRTRRASVGDMNLIENIILTCYDRFSGIVFRKKSAYEYGKELIKEYEIVPSYPRVMAKQLSGGNLQKLVLARELSQNPDLIIAEQPTAGLDISSTEFVWKTLLEKRENSAILLVSGDMKEVMSISDRIAVIFRGSFMDILSVTEDQDKLTKIELMMAGFA